MDNDNITQQILTGILGQAPVLFVSILGLASAFWFWRKAPGAALWCVAALILALVSSALSVCSWVSNNSFGNYVTVPLVRAVAYALLVIGVFAGREHSGASQQTPPQTLWQPVVELFRSRPWLKSLFRTAFICTFLLAFLGSTVATFLKPETFSGTARVRLRMSPPNDGDADSDNDVVEVLDPRQIRTECEAIQSDAILGKVVEARNLNERWGAKFRGGERLTTAESMQILRSSIFIQPVRHSYIIQIRAYSDQAEEAADLANELAARYCDYAGERRKELSRGTVKVQTGLAEFMDRAMPDVRPVRLNKTLEVVLGIGNAIWLGLLVGAVVVWISIRFEKKHSRPRAASADDEPEEGWVTAQNNLGAVLRDQARRSDGVEALRLLDEAAAAYRAVLEAGIRERFPRGWAMAQNNLGVLLRDRAEWSEPSAAVNLLHAAIAAHRAALEVYTREQFRHQWRTTQNNLGVALRDLAKRSQGSKAARLLNEAVAASRAAMQP